MTHFADTRSALPIRRNRPTLLQLMSIWKQRRQLRTMDERALNDIGLSRQEALMESRRPLWDVPAHWLR
ncbi:MAG: DUF1127 domain-containing protein [Paracoccaceae bacterium]